MPPLLDIQKPRKYSAPDRCLTKNEFNIRIGFDDLSSPFNYRLFFTSTGIDLNESKNWKTQFWNCTPETIFIEALLPMCRCPGSSGYVSGTIATNHHRNHHCRAIATFLEYSIYRQRLCCVRPSSTSQRLIQSFLGGLMVVVAANTARSNVLSEPGCAAPSHLLSFIQFRKLRTYISNRQWNSFLLKPTSM